MGASQTNPVPHQDEDSVAGWTRMERNYLREGPLQVKYREVAEQNGREQVSTVSFFKSGHNKLIKSGLCDEWGDLCCFFVVILQDFVSSASFGKIPQCQCSDLLYLGCRKQTVGLLPTLYLGLNN